MKKSLEILLIEMKTDVEKLKNSVRSLEIKVDNNHKISKEAMQVLEESINVLKVSG